MLCFYNWLAYGNNSIQKLFNTATQLIKTLEIERFKR